MAERDYWPPESDPEHPGHEQWKWARDRPDFDDARTPQRPEWVNHPDHYGGEDNPYEVIKVIEAWSPAMAYYGCMFNVLKYTARAEKKGAFTVDIDKAAWYAQRATEILHRYPYLARAVEALRAQENRTPDKT